MERDVILAAFCAGQNPFPSLAPVDFAYEPAGQEGDPQDDPDEQPDQRDGTKGTIVAQSAGKRPGHGRRLPQRFRHLLRSDVQQQSHQPLPWWWWWWWWCGSSRTIGEQLNTSTSLPVFGIVPPAGGTDSSAPVDSASSSSRRIFAHPRQSHSGQHAVIHLWQPGRRFQHRRRKSFHSLLHTGG